MCGIVGLVARRSALDAKDVLEGMVGRVAHRGPDGRGIEIRDVGPWTIGLGHVRLSILDLSVAGAQPMTSEDGKRVLTYNGEVYNFLDVRDGLEAEGRSFRSRTDTEVILQAYEGEGARSFDRLRGMYALGLLDEGDARLVLARDPLGIKPLYYHATPDLLLFASEVRALLGTGLVPRRLDRDGLVSYFRYGSVQSPETLVEGVRSLLPGETASLDLRRPRLAIERGRIADPLADAPGRPRVPDRPAAVRAVRAALEESVRLHMVSDVPVGVFLSGGIDSAAVVALASRASSEPLRTFTVTFEEAAYDESSRARLLADRYSTRHTEIPLPARALLDDLPGAFAAMDLPTMDGVNTYVLAKAVRAAGVKVSLSGLGGDELFAGYASFRRATALRRLSRIPRPLRRGAAAVGRSLVPATVGSRKAWAILASRGTPEEACDVSRRLFLDEELPAGLTVGPAPAIPARPAADVVNAVSAREIEGYMTNTLLRDTDAMSMASALEVRVPFVDAEVVGLALSIPGGWKLEPGKPKALLVDALGDLLPEEIWRRPKQGFAIPFDEWMRGPIREEVERSFAQGGPLDRAGVPSRLARDAWDRYLRGRGERWARPWALHALARWCEAHGVAE